MERDGQLVGIFAAADTLPSEVPTALAEVRSWGIHHIELLTGDNERTLLHWRKNWEFPIVQTFCQKTRLIW